MKYVKLLRAVDIKELEGNINLELSANASDELFDIKYSSTHNGHAVIHTALVIFEKK